MASQLSVSPRQFSSLDRYMAEVSRFPLLSREDELKAARALREDGDVAAAHQLVVSNLRFVVKLAYEFRRYGVRLLDLVQEGNVGLMVAVKKFDPERGFRLITYAVWWIRAHMQSFILRSWSLVRMGSSRVQRRLFFRLRAEQARTRQALGAEYDQDDSHAMAEVARELGVSSDEVQSMDARLSHRDHSLDAPIVEGGSISHLDRLSDSEQQSPDDVAATSQLTNRVREAVAEVRPNLNAKELEILDKRLLHENAQSLQELGDTLSLSRERVRQLEMRIKARLKGALESRGLGGAELTPAA